MSEEESNNLPKKLDGRSKNGGHSTKGKAGRPPKVTEKKIRAIAVSAIKKVYGNEDKLWLEVAKQAKESFPHMKLLLEFMYGKPKEQKEISVKTDINIPIINFLEEPKETTIDITPEEITDEDESSSTEQ